MNTTDDPITRLNSFRSEVHASFPLRADALFELIDGILCPVVLLRSAVEVSLSPAYTRSHSSIYDSLTDGRVDTPLLGSKLYAAEPSDAITIAGFAVYATDLSPIPRADAKTMPERSRVYLATQDRWVDGFEYSFLGRVLAPGQSWLAPLDIRRVSAQGGWCAVAADQVRDLAKHASAEHPKAICADSNYCFPSFLCVFAEPEVKHTFGLIRVANNRVVFGDPPTDSHGNRKHGRKMHLQAPAPPDLEVLTEIDGRPWRLRAWYDVHFEKVPQVRGMLVCAQRLDVHGRPVHKRPLWLFWTGDKDVSLVDLVRMYLLRFTIEHFLRFSKDRLGLLAAHTPDPAAQDRWVWCIGLAYWNLLLGRTLVVPQHRPWDPSARRDPGRPLTPGQVLRAWPLFAGSLKPVAQSPRPAGKPAGRPKDLHPEPRQRHPVVNKKPLVPKKKPQEASKQKVKAPEIT